MVGNGSLATLVLLKYMSGHLDQMTTNQWNRVALEQFWEETGGKALKDNFKSSVPDDPEWLQQNSEVEDQIRKSVNAMDLAIRKAFVHALVRATLCHPEAPYSMLYIRYQIDQLTEKSSIMALPAKNRRKIKVKEDEYYWQFNGARLSGNDSYIAVQSVSGKGRKLFLRWIGLALPRFIRSAIEFASQNGWSPDADSDMEIGCDSFSNPPRFYLKPKGSGQHWFHDWWLEQNPGHTFLTPVSDYEIEHWK